jgi:hypothetical protein
MWKTRPHGALRAHTSRNLHARTTLVRAMCVLGPDSSCITPDILRKCALVARHESPSSSVRFKRRQSASNVDGDNAAGAPDDRANTDLVPTEPSTSGLGQLWEVGRPSRAAECQSPRGPRHDVERKLDKPKPANSGAPAAYPLCSSKQSRPIIPRTRKLKAGSKPRKHRSRRSGPGPALPFLP